jgi:hypothetical protein
MSWRFTPIMLLGLALTVVTIVFLKGGESMPLLSDDPASGIGLPTSNMNHSAKFETATFALG